MITKYYSFETGELKGGEKMDNDRVLGDKEIQYVAEQIAVFNALDKGHIFGAMPSDMQKQYIRNAEEKLGNGEIKKYGQQATMSDKVIFLKRHLQGENLKVFEELLADFVMKIKE